MSKPSRPVVLVTRPDPDGAALATELSALGYRPILSPLMQVEIHRQQLGLAGVQALAFTSANGVRAFCQCTNDRSLPVFAVGDATARLATEMGFGDVSIAGGDVELLADLISGKADPAAGSIFHGSGSHVAGDLAGRLTAQGFAVVSEKLYTAQNVGNVLKDVAHALEKGEVDVVLLFSPRTAALFDEIVRRDKLEQGLHQTVAVCMSQNVATAIKSLPFQAVHVSSAPTKAAVFEALENSVPHA